MSITEREYEKIENKLYQLKHFPAHMLLDIQEKKEMKSFWDEVKQNNALLDWATTVRKDKWGQKDTFNGITICESMLEDYSSVNRGLYNQLVQNIYSNIDLARIVINGASNGGWSFLLLALDNKGYNLSDNQKAFAVSEAMNMHGTIKDKELSKSYEDFLDKNNVTNDDTVIADYGSIKVPMGRKTYAMHMQQMFRCLDSSQAHGIGSFDIRYHILHNPNWTDEEKKTLIQDFWADQEDYLECLNEWEWGIINDNEAFLPGSFMSDLDPFYLYDYTKDDLLNIYHDSRVVDHIMSEIDFCKKMKQLRTAINFELELE